MGDFACCAKARPRGTLPNSLSVFFGRRRLLFVAGKWYSVDTGEDGGAKSVSVGAKKKTIFRSSAAFCEQ